jgi:hypothetical protein
VGFWTAARPTLSWHKSWNIRWTNFLTGKRPDLEVWEFCPSQTENEMSMFFFAESSPLSKFRCIFYCAVNLYETAWNVRHMSTTDNVVIRCLTRKTNPWRTHSIINQSLCNFSTNLKRVWSHPTTFVSATSAPTWRTLCYYSRQDARKRTELWILSSFVLKCNWCHVLQSVRQQYLFSIKLNKLNPAEQ